MTKKHWKEILEFLREIRKTNFTSISYNDKEILKINVDNMTIWLLDDTTPRHRIVLSHKDVATESLKYVKSRFWWKQRIFK